MDLSKITEVREVALRSTGMSDHEKCPRYFLFRHRAGLVPRGGTAPALQRGDMFHRIVADLLRGKLAPSAEAAALSVMGSAIADLVTQVGPAGYLPNGQTPEEATKAIEANTRVAIAMSRAYARFFAVGPGTISGLRVLDNAIEVDISFLNGSGTLDAIAVDDAHGETWVVDHKTCGWDLVQYARTLPLSAQSLLYPSLARGMGPVVGICYNVIKTPTIRCCKTDGFDLTRYAARVEKWYEENENETMLRTFIHPSQELVKFSQPRLDRARSACVSLPVLSNFAATGGSACQSYNTLCPYIGLCTRDTAGWSEELKRYDRDWRDENDATGD
jgi:hypothetical protein